MNNIINNLLLTLITVALLYGVKILNARSKDLTKNIKNERVKDAIDKTIKIINLAVQITNQEFVDDLKKIDGFTLDQQEEAFNNTKVKILEMLDKETKEILEEEYKNSDKFINDIITAKVWENKDIRLWLEETINIFLKLRGEMISPFMFL